ncbi:MAG: cytochrome oxidase small assembly protein [Burkholderiaceae bacterium]
MTGPEERRQRNLRTALILLSIALAFFLGVMAKYWLIGK